MKLANSHQELLPMPSRNASYEEGTSIVGKEARATSCLTTGRETLEGAPSASVVQARAQATALRLQVIRAVRDLGDFMAQ